jgi:glycosyltransferase involved in cell wall biosynthesis
MRIVVLDYSGHIPQADLARSLAKIGHNVRHMYCSDYVSGRGAVEREVTDPINLEFIAISIKKDFNRYNLIERIKHESSIAKEFWLRVQDFNPDHTIFSNVPLFAMSKLAKKMQNNNRTYLFWWQDVYSIAIGNALKKFGVLTWSIRYFLIRLEKNILKGAQSVVAISSNFEQNYRRWKQDQSKYSIYPNWTPVNIFPKKQPSPANLNRKLAVYAGTLGLKHRPELLLQLADDSEFQETGGVVVVVSEGYGREFLEKPEHKRQNIELHDFLSIAELAQLFSYASVLIAVLEPEASAYSVPSKIMSYLSAGKPIVASIDPDNASANIIKEIGAGIVVAPADSARDFSKAVSMIISNTHLSISMSEASAKYSEKYFDSKVAADFFLKKLSIF